MRMTVETVGIRLFVCLSVSVCQVGSSDNTPPVCLIGEISAAALVYGKSGDDPIGRRSVLFVRDLRKKGIFRHDHLNNTVLI